MLSIYCLERLMPVHLKLSGSKEMEAIYTTRLDTLADLMKEKNIATYKELSQILGLKPAAVSRMIITKTLPERYCRHIEKLLDKPPLWLDSSKSNPIRSIPGYFFDLYKNDPDEGPLFFIDKIAKEGSFCIKIGHDIGYLMTGTYLTFEPATNIQDLKHNDICLIAK